MKALKFEPKEKKNADSKVSSSNYSEFILPFNPEKFLLFPQFGNPERNFDLDSEK